MTLRSLASPARRARLQGWTALSPRSTPIIDFDSLEPQIIAVSADLRSQYPSTDPWREYLRPCPVVVNAVRLGHVKGHGGDKARVEILRQLPHIIVRALEESEIVYS